MTHTDIETYRGRRIVAVDTRGHMGYAVFPGGEAVASQCLARGLPTIEAARAKIDKILDRPAPRRRL